MRNPFFLLFGESDREAEVSISGPGLVAYRGIDGWEGLDYGARGCVRGEFPCVLGIVGVCVF